MADLYALLYLYEWTNEAAVSNRAPIEIDRLYDSDVFTKLNIDNSCVTDLWLCQKGLPRWLAGRNPGSHESMERFIRHRTEPVWNCAFCIFFRLWASQKSLISLRAASYMPSKGSRRPSPTATPPQPGGDHKSPFCSEARVDP